MIGRRLLFAGAASLPVRTARAGLPVPLAGRLAFHIIRNDSTIGEHSLTFAANGDALTVSVAVDIRVGLGPIPLFRYKHRATEQWQGELVIAVDAETDDDGTPRRMSARREAGGLVVEGSKAPRYTAPPGSLPGTHWNRTMLKAPFINTEDGRLMSPTVTLTGVETVTVAAGSVEAQHYTLRGDANLDTFYDLTPCWVGLRFTGKDGSAIRYLRA
jgi:hypothetical protein